jgi:hypothetical protein
MVASWSPEVFDAKVALDARESVVSDTKMHSVVVLAVGGVRNATRPTTGNKQTESDSSP